MTSGCWLLTDSTRERWLSHTLDSKVWVSSDTLTVMWTEKTRSRQCSRRWCSQSSSLWVPAPLYSGHLCETVQMSHGLDDYQSETSTDVTWARWLSVWNKYRCHMGKITICVTQVQTSHGQDDYLCETSTDITWARWLSVWNNYICHMTKMTIGVKQEHMSHGQDEHLGETRTDVTLIYYLLLLFILI